MPTLRLPVVGLAAALQQELHPEAGHGLRILTDKANAAAGRPTMISGRSPDERDGEIERLLQEEAAKRGASTQAELDREVDELVEKLRSDGG